MDQKRSDAAESLMAFRAGILPFIPLWLIALVISDSEAFRLIIAIAGIPAGAFFVWLIVRSTNSRYWDDNA
jgi:ABC-type enterobactin transport system permease subunit